MEFHFRKYLLNAVCKGIKTPAPETASVAAVAA